MRADSRRWRWWAVGLVVVLVGALLWWLPDDAPLEPSTNEVAAPAPAPMSPAPVAVAPSVAAPVMDADAGEPAPDDEPVPDGGVLWTRSFTWFLGPGNTISHGPPREYEFQKACNAEADACERFLEFDEDPPSMLYADIEGEPGHGRVTGLKNNDEQTEFVACMVRGLKARTFLETGAPGRACSLSDFRERRSPAVAQERAIVRCVGTDASAEALSVTTVVRAEGGFITFSEPVVTALGRLDLSTESCIRLAVQRQSQPVTPEQAARFHPYRQSLNIVLSGPQQRPRVDLTDARDLFMATYPFRDGPPVSEEAQREAAQRADESEAALQRNDAKGARTAAQACLEVNRGELRCRRALALAWLSLASAEGESLESAVLAWLNFVKRAPADDPDSRRLQLALIAAGWRE